MNSQSGSQKTKFRKLLDKPFVFVVTIGSSYFSSGVFQALKEANGAPCHILVQTYWFLPDMVSSIVSFQKQARIDFKNVQFTYLCNLIEDVRMLHAIGIDALHIHQNAFIDEKIFLPRVFMPKKYDAVHNANVHPFKRHQLAWQTENIAIVTYLAGDHPVEGALSGYRDIAYCNVDGNGRATHLNPEQVSKVLCQSICGIILSEKEGANFASAEYLFCGIPVVSTPSKGGRDEFFDVRHVTIVDPDPASVAKAVQQWKENPIEPQEIRAAVLAKAREHRRRLLGWLCAISNQDLFADVDENFWSPIFVNKLVDDMEVGSYDRIEIKTPPKLLYKRIIWEIKSIFVKGFLRDKPSW